MEKALIIITRLTNEFKKFWRFDDEEGKPAEATINLDGKRILFIKPAATQDLQFSVNKINEFLSKHAFEEIGIAIHANQNTVNKIRQGLSKRNSQKIIFCTKYSSDQNNLWSKDYPNKSLPFNNLKAAIVEDTSNKAQAFTEVWNYFLNIPLLIEKLNLLHICLSPSNAVATESGEINEEIQDSFLSFQHEIKDFDDSFKNTYITLLVALRDKWLNNTVN